jgi:ABC-type ATPase involved in cell division
VTVLVATHDLELIGHLPHRQLKLVAGQLAGDSGHGGP